MKLAFILCAFLVMQVPFLSAQNTTDTTEYVPEKMFVITKNDGTEYIAKILSQDAREVLIETKDLGQIIIPKHEIRSIIEIREGELDRNGKYIAEEAFATRYFLTTNGIPLQKGESYLQFNLFGPDFQIGLSNKFSLGFITSWIGAPFAATVKYSAKLGEKVHLGVGGILGTMSWAFADYGLAVPFTSLTFGDKRSNVTFSTGYGAFFGDGESTGRLVLSIGAMKTLGSKVSFIFDSIILPSIVKTNDVFAAFFPGLRWHTSSKGSFQFGIGMFSFSGEFFPLPLPMVQWYRKLN